METTRVSSGILPPDHEHHAELAYRVGEGQHTGGEEAPGRQGDGDSRERIERTGTEARGGFQRRPPDRGERGLQRLHHEWQRIHHRRDHQARKGECQGVAGHLHPKRSDDGPRMQQDQQVEAEHGRREHEGQCGQRFDGGLDRGARVRQPPGERRSEGEQHQGRDTRQLCRQPDGAEFHYCFCSCSCCSSP